MQRPTKPADSSYLGAALAALALAVWISNALAVAAHAQSDPACPTKPPALSNSLDASAVEMRELRRDLADQCSALHFRLDELRTTTRQVRDRLGTQAEADAATIAGRLAALGPKVDGIKERLDQPLTLWRGEADPLLVKVTASGSASTPDHGQSDDDPTWVRLSTPSLSAVDSIQAGVYVLVGVVLGLFFGSQLLRRLL